MLKYFFNPLVVVLVVSSTQPAWSANASISFSGPDSPNVTIDASGSSFTTGTGNFAGINNPNIVSAVEAAFPSLVGNGTNGNLFRVFNIDSQSARSITFNVASGAPIDSFTIFGLQRDVELTSFIPATVGLPVTHSISNLRPSSNLSLADGATPGTAGMTGGLIQGSINTPGGSSFTGPGNNIQGVGIIEFSSPVTSFTLTDIQTTTPNPGGSDFDTYFIAFPVIVPEPSSSAFLGAFILISCLRRKRAAFAV